MKTKEKQQADRPRIEAKELNLRSEVSLAAQHELQRIDREIDDLKRQKKELRKIISEVKVAGRTAYLLMRETGEMAARDFGRVQGDARSLVGRILDMRGCCDLWRELTNRHVDQWVKLI